MECGNVQIAFGFHTCRKVNFACMFFQRLIIVVCGLRLHCLQTSSEVDICRALWSYTSLANFIKRRSWCAAFGFGIALGFGMSSNVDLGLHVCIVCGSNVLLFVDSRIRMSAHLYTYMYIYIYTYAPPPPHLIRNRDFD